MQILFTYHYALLMPDGFNFTGVQSALNLKGALDDVSKRSSGATIYEHESTTVAQDILTPRHDPLANSLKLQSSDFKKLGVGDLVELKQPNGEIKFGLVKQKHNQDNIVTFTPISVTQASTIQHNFPKTHYLVLSKFMPAHSSTLNWFGWDFSKVETLIAAFTDYFLALMEKVVGKQLSRVELESKGLALLIALVVLFGLAIWVYILWQQF